MAGKTATNTLINNSNNSFIHLSLSPAGDKRSKIKNEGKQISYNSNEKQVGRENQIITFREINMSHGPISG